MSVQPHGYLWEKKIIFLKQIIYKAQRVDTFINVDETVYINITPVHFYLLGLDEKQFVWLIVSV